VHADDDDGILQSPYLSRILERAQSLLDQEESRLERFENGGRTE
jgi:hypothetical protein